MESGHRVDLQMYSSQFKILNVFIPVWISPCCLLLEMKREESALDLLHHACHTLGLGRVESIAGALANGKKKKNAKINTCKCCKLVEH